MDDIFGRTTELHQHLGTTTAATAAVTRYRYDPAGNLISMTDPKGNQWSYSWDLQGNQLTAKDPDKGLSSLTYDLVGRQTSSTDARGVTVRYFYDTIGRPTKTTKADGSTLLTSTVYDTVKKGLPTSSSRHVNGAVLTSKVNSYDTAGRPTSTSMVVPEVSGLIGAQLAGSYTTTTSYNADGSTNTIGLPATGPIPAETLTYGYTATGLPKTLTGTIGTTAATYVTDTQYLQYGTIAAVLLGTHASKAIMASYVRDTGTLRLTGTKLNRQVNPGVTDETTTLSYTPGGTITQARAVLVGSSDNQCFGYDYQQQLTEAWTPTGTACDSATRSQTSLGGPSPYWSSWTVDTIGRTLSRVDRTGSTSTTTSYIYPADGAASVRPHLAASATATGAVPATANYTGDDAGNLTSRPGPGGQQTLVWDDTNQLAEVQQDGTSLARMVYDASGARLVRQQGATTTVYLAGTELSLTGTALAARRYYSHGGQIWAVRTGVSNDTVTTLVPDHQGTTHHQVTNATGALQTTWQTPYGAPRGGAPAGWVGERGFVGGTTDATGLVRTGARDYDPVLQRFVTVDPVQDLADPLQWNAYLYANNSPITNSDPTGLMRMLPSADVGGGRRKDPTPSPRPANHVRTSSKSDTQSSRSGVRPSPRSNGASSSERTPGPVSRFMVSFGQSLWDNGAALLQALGETILDPLCTQRGMKWISVVAENGFGETAASVWADITKPYTSRLDSGDLAGAIGYGTPDIILAVVGTKGVTKLTKGSAAVTRAVTKATKTAVHSVPIGPATENAWKVLNRVDAKGAPLPGYKGGKVFGNTESRLPSADSAGNPISYREWDISPYVKGVDRGAERIVTGSDGAAYLTRDHYDSFVMFRGSGG